MDRIILAGYEFEVIDDGPWDRVPFMKLHADRAGVDREFQQPNESADAFAERLIMMLAAHLCLWPLLATQVVPAGRPWSATEARRIGHFLEELTTPEDKRVVGDLAHKLFGELLERGMAHAASPQRNGHDQKPGDQGWWRKGGTP